ncbi:hypothetical protein GYMLUDRAFT_50487 [Collybiopsis luxurians FD-317 M1]|uniref:Uncharacterized protein n=1 Tax=Collybiopsis luxurians FD-317 M1 TaxID=944289 RepID=A0A0D0BB53_9AGAR|nr:hypothetical protein GYMLUDRAFT_50487 [Collybiopsis luxurians FD-317 M1]
MLNIAARAESRTLVRVVIDVGANITVMNNEPGDLGIEAEVSDRKQRMLCKCIARSLQADLCSFFEYERSLRNLL